MKRKKKGKKRKPLNYDIDSEIYIYIHTHIYEERKGEKRLSIKAIITSKHEEGSKFKLLINTAQGAAKRGEEDLGITLREEKRERCNARWKDNERGDEANKFKEIKSENKKGKIECEELYMRRG